MFSQKNVVVVVVVFPFFISDRIDAVPNVSQDPFFFFLFAIVVISVSSFCECVFLYFLFFFLVTSLTAISETHDMS